MAFYIKNKKTGEFFAGFAEDQSPLWGSVDLARPYKTKLLAKCQSTCLARFGLPAQLKPVQAMAV